jgi:hypothetical protein
MERLEAAVSTAVRGAPSMQGVIEHILGEVNGFCAGRLRDDIAAVAVRIF